MKGKCAKQETIAIIENNGRYWIDSNWCHNPQDTCPRYNMKTGEGYELCETICNQSNHAEVNVCLKAKHNAEGGILYLIGHTYCCDYCLSIIKEYGIKDIIIGKLPKHLERMILK